MVLYSLLECFGRVCSMYLHLLLFIIIDASLQHQNHMVLFSDCHP